MFNDRYAIYKSQSCPYFELVRDALEGLVDGKHIEILTN
jgi:hypothetical protein